MRKKKEFLGDLEEIILLVIVNLGGEAYGVPIYETIERATQKFTSLGAIYVALDRLEQKGFVSSRLGEVTSERGGRAKKYFRIEGEGIKALQDVERMRQDICRASKGLQPIGGRV